MENDLKLKLTVAEYERQQVLEETAILKVQLQKVDHLQDDIMALTNALNAMKIENEKLEASLCIMSGDYDKLKVEKISFLEKISSLQKDALKLEEYKQNRVNLEEKFQGMEGELAEKSALCDQDVELKNKLNMMKSTNRQLQRKIQELEKGKGECGKRAQLAEALETNNVYENQLNRVLSDSRNNYQDNSRTSKSEGEVVPKEKFDRTRSSLQAELRDLRDRYLDMSLKYAEVESHREELVMKLKNVTRGKRLGFF